MNCCAVLFGAFLATTCILTGADNIVVASANHQYCPEQCVCYDPSTVACANLSSNQVSALLHDDAFAGAFSASLRNFSLRYSEVSDLMPAAVLLTRFPQILFLDFSYNDINATASPDGASLSAVIVLDLGHNRLAAIERDAFVPLFANVEEIHIEGNGIFTVQWEAFRLLKLRRLNLAHNHLATINEHMLRFTPNLEQLDLSHNQLTLAQSSSFFAAQQLSRVDLSHNRIQRFRYDSFAPLFQLKWFNLAFNNLSQVPPDLRQFIALRTLNISGNPMERICVGELDHPVLQVLDVSNCPRLRLIEAGAFSKLPNLQTAIITNNSALRFISPQAFRSVKMLYELDLSHNALTTVNESLVQLPTRLRLADNPLDCACVAPLVRYYAQHVIDAGDATCGSPPRRIADATASAEVTACGGGAAILPLGDELNAQIGDFFSIYCAPKNANDTIVWTIPNGTQMVASDTEIIGSIPPAQGSNFYVPLYDDTRQFASADTSTAGAHSSGAGERRLAHAYAALLARLSAARRRIVITKEQMRFEVLTAADAGDYRCRVVPAGNDFNKPQHESDERTLHLRIDRPAVGLSVVQMGSHYASLVWNASLRVRAVDKVALSLDVRDAASGQLLRSIQLSLFNPWYSYNVMRLKPLNNYTFCLAYRLLDYNTNEFSYGSAAAAERSVFFEAAPPAGGASPPDGTADAHAPIFEMCVNGQTTDYLSFWKSLDASTIATFAAVFFVVVGLMIARAVYLRFYIWQETKLRARMNESLSGQSFLSNSSSAHTGGFSRSTTFENTPQVLDHCAMNGRGVIGEDGRLSSGRKSTASISRRTNNGIGYESSRMLKFDDIAV